MTRIVFTFTAFVWLAASALGVEPKAGEEKAAAVAPPYYEVTYQPSSTVGELSLGVTYTLWVPPDVKTLRGVIVHQHGCGTGACKGGATAAYDLHWQALAAKWDCALLGPSYHQEDGQNCRNWCDPRNGSSKTFLRALDDFAAAAKHPELKSVPWCLWGHSGGAFWASLMQVQYPERIVAIWFRSGTAFGYWEKGEIAKPEIPKAAYAIPMMLNPGQKEKGHEKFSAAWTGSMAMFEAYRKEGGLVGFAPDPRTAHECGDSRYLAIPFFDACLKIRLPATNATDTKLRIVDSMAGYIGAVEGATFEPAVSFNGEPEEGGWLPNEAVAKAWVEYVKTGATPDVTPPAAPTNVTAAKNREGQIELTWNAEADFESGLAAFVILRDGKELARVPEKPVAKFGRPLFQGMSFHDTPEAPLAQMRYVDAKTEPEKKHEYRVIAVNSVELKSVPSAVSKETVMQAGLARVPDALVASDDSSGGCGDCAQAPSAKTDTAAKPAAAEVPKGDVTKYTFAESKIFPGTVRDYWIYVPKQYDPAKPACTFVCQDGIQYKAPEQMDKLIAAGDMPVTIGVFVMHGRVKATSDAALDRFNRSYEYDGLGDAYARFLLEELLPDVETKKTADGRAIKLSKDGNDRCIAGNSSGAIAAFTAAWERPDAFSRVFSGIGTYVGLRGGNEYPTLIRKYEPKPIRIFLQDGSADQNIYGGDWWMANLEMERALKFAGYEVEHAWGDGGHNGKHATEIFPDAMRYLWKGWPERVKAGSGSPQLQEILLPGEEWKLVPQKGLRLHAPVANFAGEIFFGESPDGGLLKLDASGKLKRFVDHTSFASGQAFGPDGRLYRGAWNNSAIIAVDGTGKEAVFAGGVGVAAGDLVVRHNGSLYVTEPLWSSFGDPPSRVVYIDPKGERNIVDEGLVSMSGVTLSPDQSLLYVADSRSHWVYSYQIAGDGTLSHKQRYFHLHVPDTAEDAGTGDLAVDRDGRLYVGTRMGIQVCDQAGRVNCIIPGPSGRVNDLTFGSPQFDVLYATSGNQLYARKVKTIGAQAFAAPIKPKPPRL